MGVMEDSLGSNNPSQGVAGFTTFPESKYYDIYKYGAIATDHTRYRLGDATTETTGWNSDYASFINTSGQWFIRSGSYGSSEVAGIYSFSYISGPANSSVSSRSVLR